MKTACSVCGKSYKHIIYNPPRKYRGGFYGYDVVDTTVDSVEVAYDENGKPYPKFVERKLPVLIIKEDWVQACSCVQPVVIYDNKDTYCPHCTHCNPEEGDDD